MKTVFSILLFLQSCLFAVSTDYDYVVVGTSPFSMLQALYQYHSGYRVLILDEADTYGGAWRSISSCGIENVDMGCHEIGCETETKTFLEDFVGCHLLSLDDPRHEYVDPPPPDSKGFYPSRGCHELVENLKRLINATEIDVLMNHRLESIYLDAERNIAEIRTGSFQYTTSKIVITPASTIKVENSDISQNDSCSTKHYHLYLLIEDTMDPAFTYEDDIIEEVSRAANLSWYTGLAGSGKQLIVIQTYTEADLDKGEEFLEALKNKNYFSPNARILKSEHYIYQQCHHDTTIIEEMGPLAESIFDIMDTYNFGCMPKYIGKWKEVLKPYHEVLDPS